MKTLLVKDCAGSVNSAFIAQSCTMIPHNRFPEPVGEVSGIALLYSASAESLSYGTMGSGHCQILLRTLL